MGLGNLRNQLCSCGSGKKFKNCCLNPDRGKYEILTQIREEFSKQKYCIHPSKNECSGNIVKAHTISKSLGLIELAHKNHVYSLPESLDFFDYLNPTLWSSFKPKLVGINNASTFTGFCSYHDNSTFAPFEKNGFEICEEHIFLFSYRILAYKLFKEQFNRYYWERMSELPSIDQSAINMKIFCTKTDLQELMNLKIEYDIFLQRKDFSKIKYVVLHTDKTTKFLCADGCAPILSFNGTLLQNPNNLNIELDFLTFFNVKHENKSIIVFSWLKENNNACSNLLNSLVDYPKSQLQDAIIRFIFNSFDNISISPTWWDSLTDNDKRYLIRMMPIKSHNGYMIPSSFHIDDFYHLANFKIAKIDSNVNRFKMLLY